METPWKRANEMRHVKQERNFGKSKGANPQLNSGRFWHSKRDNKKFSFLVENRTTNAGSYTIKAKELKQLTRDAFFHSNIPAMNIEFEKESEDWTLIRSVDLEEMQERMLGLEAALEAFNGRDK